MLLFPFADARPVLDGCIDIAASAPDELTVQLGTVFGPDGIPVVIVVPTWGAVRRMKVKHDSRHFSALER